MFVMKALKFAKWRMDIILRLFLIRDAVEFGGFHPNKGKYLKALSYFLSV